MPINYSIGHNDNNPINNKDEKRGVAVIIRLMKSSMIKQTNVQVDVVDRS